MNKLSFGEKNIVAEGPMAEAAELKRKRSDRYLFQARNRLFKAS